MERTMRWHIYSSTQIYSIVRGISSHSLELWSLLVCVNSSEFALVTSEKFTIQWFSMAGHEFCEMWKKRRRWQRRRRRCHISCSNFVHRSTYARLSHTHTHTHIRWRNVLICCEKRKMVRIRSYLHLKERVRVLVKGNTWNLGALRSALFSIYVSSAVDMQIKCAKIKHKKRKLRSKRTKSVRFAICTCPPRLCLEYVLCAPCTLSRTIKIVGYRIITSVHTKEIK